ncbi:MAG: hypothetical protein IT448_05080 [Phycisphaerales bacterium]|nr:hypothetical protein [Phycisphaerales bacterium]
MIIQGDCWHPPTTKGVIVMGKWRLSSTGFVIPTQLFFSVSSAHQYARIDMLMIWQIVKLKNKPAHHGLTVWGGCLLHQRRIQGNCFLQGEIKYRQ